MKAKHVYHIVVGSCGLLLLIGGVGCVVAATILDYDEILSENNESRSRTYSTQYWLGIPLICYGIMLLVMTAVHRRKKLIVFSLFLVVPMIILSFIGSVLHGTSFAYFKSIKSRQAYLSDQGYTCEDSSANQCSCRNRFQLRGGNEEIFHVPCDKQSTLVSSHGAIFSFIAISFGLLFGILFINIIFTLTILNFQLPVNAGSAENQGFSNQGEDRPSEIRQNETREPQQPQNQSELSLDSHHQSHHGPPVSHEPPPSYESLLTSFVVTAERRNVGRNPANVTSRRPPEANHHATVRYRGQLNSSSVYSGSVERGLEQQTTIQEGNNSTVSNQSVQNNSDQRNQHGDHAASIQQEEQSAGTGIISRESNAQSDEQLETHEHPQSNSPSSSEFVAFHDNPQSIRGNLANNHVAVYYRGQSNSNTEQFTQISSENSRPQEVMQQDNPEHNVHQSVHVPNDVERRREEHEHEVTLQGVSTVAAEGVTDDDRRNSTVINEQPGSLELPQNTLLETRALPDIPDREHGVLSQHQHSLSQLTRTLRPNSVMNMEDLTSHKPHIQAGDSRGQRDRSLNSSREEMFDAVVDI